MTKIDAVIISKTEKFWKEFKEKAEKQIFDAEKEIEINKNLIKLADSHIKNK